MENQVKKWRLQGGLTQNVLAKALGVRRETIVHLEAGRYNPSLSLALKLSVLLRQPVHLLFALDAKEQAELQGATALKKPVKPAKPLPVFSAPTMSSDEPKDELPETLSSSLPTWCL